MNLLRTRTANLFTHQRINSFTRLLVVSLFTVLIFTTAANAKTIYVDADANGIDNGTSWVNAYPYLQDGLAAALDGDEIRVAQGVYKPDEGSGVTDGLRTETFQLINGVTLKGGYAGDDEPDPNARDINNNLTTLSGDLNGNDVGDLDDPSRAENSYHIVTGNTIGADQHADVILQHSPRLGRFTPQGVSHRAIDRVCSCSCQDVEF